ncbi:integrase core domain protein [Lasius niger]|uniref:Integrase core domain protein n=1 Tax=Lasius niger TaxID=67767 RepID=A0A0J7KFP8_LASNI|nr:integrase core domain protein [Lasius niger]
MIDKFVNGKWHEARIEILLYIPKVRKNLFSVGVCTSKGFEVIFKGKNVTFERDSKIVITGVKQDNEIYRMLFKVKRPQSSREANITTTSLRVWHERMGHINIRVLKEMIKKGLISGAKSCEVDNFFCESCPLGKSHHLAFKKAETKKDIQPGEIIHSDVCRPMSVESPGGSRYFVTFKDKASGFRYVYFIKYKSDVTRFKEYKRLIANKFGRPIKVLRSDNGREYTNQELKEYLITRGICFETTAPYTPQQNGKSERDNRTIVESVRTMIQAKDLSLLLWAEAVSMAVYVLNRTLSSANDEKTSYKIWKGKAPSVSHLRVFGSDPFMHIDKQFRKKFDPKVKKLIMVGYQGDSTNYRLYDLSTRRVSVSRDVVFKEEQLGESSVKNEVCNEYTFPNYKEDEREALEEAEDNEPKVLNQQ